MKQFSYVFCIYYYYYFFGIKNKWLLHTTYPKREVSFKAPKIFFFWEALSRSFTVAISLGMLRAKFRVRLKWPNMYPCFAWSCMILLFIYLWLLRFCMILCCMIFCFVYCLLKAFPNCHSVCHPNNNMYTPLSTTCGGTNHGYRSSLDLGTQWRTHQPNA